MSAVERIQAAIDKLTDLDKRWLVDSRNPLFVTLHHTIDAQVAILQFGIKRQEAIDWTARVAGDKHREAASLELALADAILGPDPH